MPAALDIDWSPIRDAAIAGVPLRVLAERFNVGYDAIRQRVRRHNWPVPAKVRTLAAQHGVVTAPPPGSKQQVSQGVQRAVLSGQNAALVAGEVLARNGEQGSLAASELLLKLLQAASAESLKPLQDVQDVVTAAKGVRLVAGLDKQDGPSVVVSLGGWQAAIQAREVAPQFVESEELSE